MTKHVSLEQGQAFQMGRGSSRRLVSPETGAEQITLNYSIFQPGHEFPQHLHEISADIFIVLVGGVSVRQGDVYTPITAGEFAYIPPGEVHGTVNQTDEEAILISFQCPPDMALYRGERDPSITGIVPKPPTGHRSQFQIRSLVPQKPIGDGEMRSWVADSPDSGTQEMVLSYYELDGGASITLPAQHNEAVWFVWLGQVNMSAGGERFTLSSNSAAFVPAGESQTIVNSISQMARLIHCLAR